MTGINERLSAALSDRYRIERELGQGGMATVYLAEDLKHKRRVAVKVLKPELASAIGPERFLREIETTARLRHPHIVPLYDSGDAAGFLFYAMPFVEGESLRNRLTREKQLPLDDALQIAREVADALGYAQGRGVIHRDIKPENILLESGHAVVADFGIARAVSAAGGSSLTQAGTAIGTPAYMSPEQAAGERDLDGRSDVYALGCVTYEMLAGQPPFTGPTVESLIHQHLLAAPRPLTQLRSAVPVAVASAVQRALAKNPADRFANLGEFTSALRADAQSGSVRMARRWALGVVAVLAALAMVLLLWLGRRNAKSEAVLDPNVIAVLPFRVGGAPTVNYLRESMLDLLQARLSGGAGTRTVEPRTLLAAWRRAVRSESEDLSEDASRALAAKLGAGRVLLGSAIATPSELTLSGTLLSVGDGSILARESVAGAPDSIAALVSRLTAALLIRDAGEAGERSAGLAAASLDALQDYLAGRKAYRRGDYFGAMELYERAFVRDSMFVEAAFSMVATNAWIGDAFATSGIRVIPRVWQMRDRLGARDLGLFLAMPAVGPNYPRPSDYADIIAQAERAASQAPDSPEHWLLLGQLLTSYGAAASRHDWRSQEVAALDRAVALDSSFSMALGARLYAALSARDQPTIAHVAGLLESRVPNGFADDFFLWAAARSRGDNTAAIRWRDRSLGLSRKNFMQKLLKISLFSVELGLPLADARWASARLRHEAATNTGLEGVRLAELAVRFAEGRADLGDVYLPSGAAWAARVIQPALIEPAYRRVAMTVLAAEAAGAYDLRLPGGREIRWPPVQLCLATLLRLVAGDTSGTGTAINGLRRFAVLEPPPVERTYWVRIEPGVCPLLLEVLRERPPQSGARWAHLDALDSIMQRGPRGLSSPGGASPTAFANYTIARLREARGELPAALAAIRRRESNGYPSYLWNRVAFLRQEGRLAVLAGDTVGAMRAYDEYLVLRTDPDPPMRAQRDSVIVERESIVRHWRRRQSAVP